MTARFAEVDDLERFFRPLSPVEKNSAEALLDAATAWIVEHKPKTDSDVLLRFACCELAKHAMLAKGDAFSLDSVGSQSGYWEPMLEVGDMWLSSSMQDALGIGAGDVAFGGGL